jgi:amino acid transporter
MSTPEIPEVPGHRTLAVELGEKRLGTIHAVGQALAIGPIFSTVLVLALVSLGAGSKAPISVLVATLGVLCIGYVLSLFARQYVGAGAVYEYLARGVHSSVGVFAAGVFFLGTIFLGGGGIYLGIGILTDQFLTLHVSDSTDWPWWLFALIALVIVLILNYIGVRLAINAVLTFTALSTIPFLILAVAVLADGGPDGLSLDPFNPSGSWNEVWDGLLIGILLFVGFEAAASIAEESREPRKSIPRAVLLTIALSGAFFILMSYVAVVGFGQAAVDEGAWVADPAAMSTLADQYVADWTRLGGIIDFVVILDAMALAIAIGVMMSRGFFALARDELLPSVFARTSRYDTPYVGSLSVAFGGILMVTLGLTLNYGTDLGLPDEFAMFIISATAGSFAVELIYLFLALGGFLLVSRAGGANAWWQYLIVVGAVVTPILGFYGPLWPFPDYPDPNNRAFWYALGAVAVAAVWYLVVQFTRPEAVADAAEYAELPEGVRSEVHEVRPSEAL